MIADINVGDLEHEIAVLNYREATRYGYTHAQFESPPAKPTHLDAPKATPLAAKPALDESQLSELRWLAAEHISTRLRELGFHAHAIGLDSIDDLADVDPTRLAALIIKVNSFT